MSFVTSQSFWSQTRSDSIEQKFRALFLARRCNSSHLARLSRVKWIASNCGWSTSKQNRRGRLIGDGLPRRRGAISSSPGAQSKVAISLSLNSAPLPVWRRRVSARLVEVRRVCFSRQPLGACFEGALRRHYRQVDLSKCSRFLADGTFLSVSMPPCACNARRRLFFFWFCALQISSHKDLNTALIMFNLSQGAYPPPHSFVEMDDGTCPVKVLKWLKWH